jgi:hypothetical protein
MSNYLTLELTFRPDSTADGEDTSGFVVPDSPDICGAPTTSPIGTIRVPVLIRLPLPGPTPERAIWVQRGEDVQGYVLEPNQSVVDPSNRAAVDYFRSAVVLAPVVIRAFNPQPDPPKTVQPSDVQGFQASDASARGQDFHFRRGRSVAITVGLPDLAARCEVIVEDKRADVQGFRWMEEMTTVNEQMDGPSSGSWYGGLVVCYQFLTDPFGTFASAATNTKP